MAKLPFHGRGYQMQKFWKYFSSLFLVSICLSLGHSASITNEKDNCLPQPATPFCTSDDCLRSAAHLKLSMNLSVNPCDNFYLYTCGRWIEQHPNNEQWPAFDGFDIIDQQVAKAETAVLTANASDNEPKSFQKMRDLYASCMDEDARDELGIAAIYQHLENANLPILPTFFSYSSDEERENFTFDWLRTEALLKKSMTVDVFIGTAVSVNIFNSSEYVIVMGRPDSETPLPSPPTPPEDPDEDEERKNLTTQVRTKIFKYILKQATRDSIGLEPEANRLQEAFEVIFIIEENLSEIAKNFTDPNASVEDLRVKNFSNLQNRTNELLSPRRPNNLWLNYFNYLFSGTNVTFDPEKDPIYVTEMELEFMSRVVAYIEQLPDAEVELYYWWNAAYAMVINTSSKIATYVTNQINILKGSDSEEVTKKTDTECTALVSKHMGYAFTYALLDKFYSNETKPKVEIMINNMRKAFMDHVHDITWMDEETKKLTIDKAEEILLYIGYPEWISNEEELDKYYDDVIIKPDEYLANIISTIRSYNMKKLGSLRKKAVREWTPRDFDQNEAIKANAFYSPQHNAIEVPMVVLRYPMYRLGLELLNYGAVGAILGHEITHAFDNDGRKFDKFGNQRTWWSNDTIENFQNLTGCFIDHYEDISLEGVDGKINGTVTLGENIADNGGLRAAFNAYHHYEKTYGVEPKLPGFENFTTNQTFFIAYASAWCMELQPKMSLEEETDAHAPHYLRVLGTLQNSVDFSAAYQCPEGSFMNPKKKCNMW